MYVYSFIHGEKLHTMLIQFTRENLKFPFDKLDIFKTNIKFCSTMYGIYPARGNAFD